MVGNRQAIVVAKRLDCWGQTLGEPDAPAQEDEKLSRGGGLPELI